MKNIFISGQEVCALFDSGADCHLIREDFFEKLKNLKKEYVFYTIKPAGTADFKSLGRTTAPTAIDGFE